ncbi:MAG: hypothetical protein J5968_07560 [Oscillospiraceae bacterium]|nr:hypothetical protein [Oscillospiraceae bacterium]
MKKAEKKHILSLTNPLLAVYNLGITSGVVGAVIGHNGVAGQHNDAMSVWSALICENCVQPRELCTWFFLFYGGKSYGIF